MKSFIPAALGIVSFLLCLSSGTSSARSTDTFVENAVIETARLSSLGADPAQLAKQLEKVKETAPDNDAVRYYLAMSLFRSNRYKEAEQEFLEALKLDPDNLTYKEMLASFYEVTGREGAAVRLRLELLEKHPEKYTNEHSLTTLADKLLSEHKDSLAMENYEKALLYDPGYIPAILGKSEVYRIRGNAPAFFLTIGEFTSDPNVNPQLKCQYLDQVLVRIAPQFGPTWLPQMDDMVRACLKAAPKDSSALKLAGRWFYGTERKEEGRQFFDLLLDCYPDVVENHLFRISLLQDTEDWTSVIEEAGKVLKLAGKDSALQITALSIMGDAYHNAGETKKAFRTYDRALKIDGNAVPILNNYAYFLSLEGIRLGKAEKMARTAVEAEPENFTYLDTLGWILHLEGRNEEAKLLFKKAIIHGGSSHYEVLKHYSLVLESLGEKDLSIYYNNLAESKR